MLAMLPVAGALVRRAGRSGDGARLRLMALVSRFSRLSLRVLDLRVEVDRAAFAGLTGADAKLFIANHISYLDVLVLSAYLPAVFVTSLEVEATPGLGAITKACGCLFVERRNRSRVLGDVQQLSALLNRGVNVMLFPEGSTSDGSRFLEFKKTLLESAVSSRAKVVPLCLRYEQIEGRPFGPQNCDAVAWYGAMAFLPHFLQLLSLESIDATLTVLPTLKFRGHRCRKRLTDEAKASIAEAYFAPRSRPTPADPFSPTLT
jgi:1-acyl-sn-glycerol-3-phosphate acyltransferase